MFVEFATALMLLAGPAPAPKPLPPPAFRHVRATSAVARFVVDEAMLRSSTVLDLISALQEHDVIVYVEIDGIRARGATSIISATSKMRFLRVVINTRLELRQQIEVLGHELHHALEIAQATGVVDEISFSIFFDRIGYRTGIGFETDAAKATEERVRRDLSQPAVASRATSEIKRDTRLR